MATVSSFKAQFPEFANTDNDLVQSAIDGAALQVNATTWGNKRELGILFLAADSLARSPFGEPARLSDQVKETIYYRNFLRLRSQVTIGFRNS